MNYKTWKIFLIWGWSIKNWETDFIEQKILESVWKKQINILMINYANSLKKDTNYLNKFRKSYDKFNEYDISFDQLNYSESFIDNIKNNKLNKADIIYFWWGNTLKLLKALKKNNLFNEIIKLYLYNNKIIVWRSAWALIFFEKFLSEKWINNNSIWIFNWFNFLKWIWSVHLTEYNEWPLLEKFVLSRKLNWIWLDECSCLIIENWQFSVFNKENKNVYKYLYNRKCISIKTLINNNFIGIHYLYF